MLNSTMWCYTTLPYYYFRNNFFLFKYDTVWVSTRKNIYKPVQMFLWTNSLFWRFMWIDLWMHKNKWIMSKAALKVTAKVQAKKGGRKLYVHKLKSLLKRSCFHCSFSFLISSWLLIKPSALNSKHH